MTANTRLKVGLAFAIGGNLLFFTSAWIAWMPWSAWFKAKLWAILFFAPETGTLICIAMIGKENYERCKALALEMWRRWRDRNKPPDTPEATGDTQDPPPDDKGVSGMGSS